MMSEEYRDILGERMPGRGAEGDALLPLDSADTFSSARRKSFRMFLRDIHGEMLE